MDESPEPLHLEGPAADAVYCVLRLMVGLDTNGAAGLRDALGTPVPEPREARSAPRRRAAAAPVAARSSSSG